MVLEIICPKCKNKMKFLPRKLESIRNSRKQCVFCGNKIRVVDFCL